MADVEPFWLDTNTISRVASGDVMLELELINIRNSGYRFLYVPEVEQELFVGNPFRGKPASPENFLRKRAAIARLNATLDRSVDPARTLELVERGFSLPRYMENDGKILASVASSAEVQQVSDPKIFSCDIDIFKNADRWGIDAWTRSSPFTISPTLVASKPDAPNMRELAAMGELSDASWRASNATAFMNALAAGNAIQVAALEKLSKEEAGQEMWEDWKLYRKGFREDLKKAPGRGYAVTFWFDYVQKSDVNFPNRWEYLGISYVVSEKAHTVPGHFVQGYRHPNARRKNLDLWLPPVYPPVAKKPVLKVGPSGPGLSYSPAMNTVEVEVYSALDPNKAKTMWQIVSETGLPEGNVTQALGTLQKKNMVAFWSRGEASGWIRLQ